MTESSDKFERSIARIKTLLEASDAVVTWNEYIADPDTPSQARQIDITIRRGEHLTIVECREHGRKQDSMWIEALHGRKYGLNADAVISLSSNGFYEPAITKAKRLGVFLRDLKELTSAELAEWGRSSSNSVRYLDIKKIELLLIFLENQRGQVKIQDYANVLNKSIGNLVFTKLNAAAFDAYSKHHELAGYVLEVDAPLDPAIIPSDMQRPWYVHLHAELQERLVRLELPKVSSYGDPAAPAEDRSVVVENFPSGESQVVHDGKYVHITTDVSDIEVPKNSMLWSVVSDFPAGMRPKGFECIGRDQLKFKFDGMKLKTEFSTVAGETTWEGEDNPYDWRLRGEGQSGDV